MLEPKKGVFATVSSGAGTIGQEHGKVCDSLGHGMARMY
jgi:hypothetical protein